MEKEYERNVVQRKGKRKRSWEFQFCVLHLFTCFICDRVYGEKEAHNVSGHDDDVGV